MVSAARRWACQARPMTSAPRLPRARRRDQLLDTAQAIVREQGTDALTLGALAERAGVSKPIAYEHFGSRSGLLIALYQQWDDRQVEALRRALERTRPHLEEVARVVASAWMNCYSSAGPEWHAIAAAMKGDDEMEAFQQQLIDRYVALCSEAFAPTCDLSRAELQHRCVGIVGAGEALSREMMRGRMGEKKAAALFASLIVAWLRATR
jgi:AcrR family transcriptional regulator